MLPDDCTYPNCGCPVSCWSPRARPRVGWRLRLWRIAKGASLGMILVLGAIALWLLMLMLLGVITVHLHFG